MFILLYNTLSDEFHHTHTHKKELKTSLGKVCKKHLKTLVVTRTMFVMSGYGHSCLMVPLPIQMQTSGSSGYRGHNSQSAVRDA